MKRFRIGMIGDKYFAQMRVWGRWKTLPTHDHYINYETLRWLKKYGAYFSTFEAASNLIQEYRLYLCPQSAVFTTV